MIETLGFKSITTTIASRNKLINHLFYYFEKFTNFD